MNQSLKHALPWWMRIPVKAGLSILPLNKRTLKQLGVFNFGGMDQPGYALRVFDQHYRAHTQWGGRPGTGMVLELGPGDSLFSAQIAKARGAEGIYLVDAGDFAQRDMRIYHEMQQALIQSGTPGVSLSGIESLEQMLERCSSEYHTHGLASLRSLPSGSVDFAWSHAVLHAVRAAEFEQTMFELRRIIRPGCLCSHEVDLRDMLGGSLNHLRFSSRFWESGIAVRAGFYSNRLRLGEMLETFTRCAFQTVWMERRTWDSLPVPRSRMHPRFRDLPDQDLLTATFHVVLRAV